MYKQMMDQILMKEHYARREKWDIRFLKMAELVSTWSKDPSTQTGAVIVRPDRSIVSLGFNGFPQSMPDQDNLYLNREEKYSRIVHCEINAMIKGATSIKDCTLYTWPFCSCDRCAVQMIQAGISRFVFPQLAEDKRERWEAAFKKSEQYFKECNIEYSVIPLEKLQ